MKNKIRQIFNRDVKEYFCLISNKQFFFKSLPCSSDLHTYNIRFSDAGNLYINKSRLRILLNSFSIFGAKLWNCLKPELRKLRKQPFKNKIHQFLLAVLGNEDNYVDVSTLMLKKTNDH